METTLSINSSDDTASILLDDGDTSCLSLQIPRREAIRLLPEITHLLAKHQRQLADIDLYACAIGPGRQSTVRIGVSIVQAMAYVHNKPTLPLCSMQLIAQSQLYGVAERGTIVLDARMGELFCCHYAQNASIMEPTAAISVIATDALPAYIENLSEVGPIFSNHPDILTRYADDARPLPSEMVHDAALLALTRHYKNIPTTHCAPLGLQPLYLKGSRMWKKQTTG